MVGGTYLAVMLKCQTAQLRELLIYHVIIHGFTIPRCELRDRRRSTCRDEQLQQALQCYQLCLDAIFDLQSNAM